MTPLIAGGKIYTDRIAYIEGLTYGQYTSLHGAPKVKEPTIPQCDPEE